MLARDTKGILHLVQQYWYELASSVVSVMKRDRQSVGAIDQEMEIINERSNEENLFHSLPSVMCDFSNNFVATTPQALYEIVNRIEQAFYLLQLDSAPQITNHSSSNNMLSTVLVFKCYWRGVQQLLYLEYEFKSGITEFTSLVVGSNYYRQALLDFVAVLNDAPAWYELYCIIELLCIYCLIL